MSDTILKAVGLNKFYTQATGRLGLSTNTIRALDNVSLTIKHGQTLAVVGESGSGKSTLARCLLQLLPLDSGEVWFKGRNLAELDAKALREQRRFMQMIFQDPFASLNPRMPIGEIVGEGLHIHALGNKQEQRDKVVSMLERVGLTAADMQKFPHQFSGGQRQRIGIARALVVEPKLVICDEPVSALDVSIQAQILLLLKELQAEMSLSYLFITHDLRIVRHIADSMMVLRHGQVVESGQVDEIYSNPQQEYTRNLLQAIPGQHRQHI
jgi:oligopeptide transport system ATP-binding protein